MTRQRSGTTQKAARLAEETIRAAEACQAIVARGVKGAELAVALTEVAARGECRVRNIMAEAPPEAARAPAGLGSVRMDASRGGLRWSCRVTFRKIE